MSSKSSPTPPRDDNKRDGDANANSKYSSSSSSTTERQEEEILGPLADAKKTREEAAGTIVDGGEDQVAAASGASAMTGTVNERLMAELQQAVETEKYGARSSMGQKMGLAGSSSSNRGSGRFRPFSSRKTDQERQAAVEEARNLNGVNPVVTLVGSMVALAIAAGLWTLTQWLAEYFALHPIESDLYVVTRVTAVFRNVVMGLVSLASGFFGVTGVGIFLLGVRVAYGVVTGELDPTPIVRKKTATNDEAAVDLGSAWDLMTNKNQKRGRR